MKDRRSGKSVFVNPGLDKQVHEIHALNNNVERVISRVA